MKILSFNCRGLASSSKKLALKKLVRVENRDIIFLQEIWELVRHSQICWNLCWVVGGSFPLMLMTILGVLMLGGKPTKFLYKNYGVFALGWELIFFLHSWGSFYLYKSIWAL